MSPVVNVTLVGVGGQGILLASDILARAAAISGKPVKKSEIHGMSQRGGSVTSQVRFCDGPDYVFGPIVPLGQTDVLVAFEKLEAARCHSLLKPGAGRAIVDDREIVATTVSSGMQEGVADIDALLVKLYGDRMELVDSTSLALKAGNARAANMVIAGALSKIMPFEVGAWHQAMRERIKPALVEVNLKAFDAGRG